MTICMVTNNYTPYAGGVVHALQTYTRALRQHGHTVYIITLDFDAREDPPHVLRVPRCFSVRLRGNPVPLPWRMHAYVEDYIRRCAPDILHLHSPFLLGRVALNIAHKKSIPTVFTYHSLYERFVKYVPVPQRAASQLVLRRVHALCQQVDARIAPSSFIKYRLLHHHLSKPTWCIPAPIREVFFASSPSISQHPPADLLYVGRFQPEKQVHYVIDAFAQMRAYLRVRLVLIGFGASYAYLHWYAYTYWQLPRDAVIFVCHPQECELVRWYRSAALFMSASPEVQGLVFAEAAASGLPVIAYDVGGAADCVQHGYNGFLVHTPCSMAQHAVHLLQHAKRWRAMCYYAMRVAQAYHPDVLAHKLSACYRSVCTSE